MPLVYRQKYPFDCCPECGAAVGLLGRFFAAVLGNEFHGCDYTNVEGLEPQAQRKLREVERQLAGEKVATGD